MAKISVIVPVYKVEPYLRRCVNSILAQSYQDFELILIDDGSPDNCGAICDEYAKQDSRVVVIHQENGGLSAARNAGIDWTFANSNSEYFTFIDSDDWVHKLYLSEMAKGAELGCDVVCVSAIHVVDEYQSICENEATWGYIKPSWYWIKERYKNSAWGKLFARNLLKELRFPIGKLYEDAYVIYKIIFSQSLIAYSEQFLYRYFRRSDSIIGNVWKESRLEELAPLRVQCSFFKNIGCDDVAQCVALELMTLLVEAIETLKKKRNNSNKLSVLKKELYEKLKEYHVPVLEKHKYWCLAVPVRARFLYVVAIVSNIICRCKFMRTFFK